VEESKKCFDCNDNLYQSTDTNQPIPITVNRLIQKRFQDMIDNSGR
jgi:hypothetical protein